jgi:hypothetical protein
MKKLIAFIMVIAVLVLDAGVVNALDKSSKEYGIEEIIEYVMTNNGK